MCLGMFSNYLLIHGYLPVRCYDRAELITLHAPA
jgi:hypothetical protein